MDAGTITDKQSISVIILYITGTSSLVIFALDSKKDLWLSILICYAMAIIMSLIVGRLKCLYPDLDMLQIFEKCYGKISSKIILTIYAISAFLYRCSYQYIPDPFYPANRVAANTQNCVGYSYYDYLYMDGERGS